MIIIENPLFESYFSSHFLSHEVLTDKERSLTLNWGSKRIMEFSTGRYCARKALLSFGIKDTEILIGPNREPMWPDHVIGSISHSDNLTGALAASKNKVKAIGLDIETIGKVEQGIWDLVFTSSEQKFLFQYRNYERALYSTLIFSAKECFYKLQFPLTKTYIDFKDVEIQIVNDNMELYFVKEFKEIDDLFANICIRYLVHNGEVVTFAFLRST